MKALRFALLLGVLAFLSPEAASAAGVYSDNCGVGNTAFGGLGALPPQCILGFPAVGNTPGTAQASVVNTDAGHDFFNNGIGMVYDTSALDQGQAAGYTFTLTTNPNWDPGIALVPTFLGLLGTVQIPDTGGSIIITVTGLLGGPIQTIQVNLNHGNCAQCTLNVPNYSAQLPAGAAVETITITSVGRVVYRTSDPDFNGAAPEPGTVGLFVGGLAMIGARKHFRARREL